LARPLKKGIDYFPLDVDIFSDTKIRVVMARFGADGFALYLYLLSKIYREGFFVRADEDFFLIASADLQMDREEIGQMLPFLLGRGLFDGGLFEREDILTSRGVQERYQEAVKARAAKNPVTVDGRYWLLEGEETAPFIQVRRGEGFSGNNPAGREEKTGESGENPPKKRREEPKKNTGEATAPAPPPEEALRQRELEKQYGQKLAAVYIAKARGYGYTGGQAMDKAAQWLAEDELKGKIRPAAGAAASLDMEAYQEMVMSRPPEFRGGS